ncbi:hypothetical protein AQZ50_17710 [Novosphingobium sp. Fuku2-ISO-50]|nr:hypothetical protein AQZ50_17710 [Novosphingobium sp. Fuku2-ISO-50]
MVNAVGTGVGWIGGAGVIVVSVEAALAWVASLALADLSRAVWPVPVPIPVPVAALVATGVAAGVADAAKIRLVTGKDLPGVAAGAGGVAGAAAVGKVAAEASCCACKVDANPPVAPDEAPESLFAAGLGSVVEVVAAGVALTAEAAAAIVTVIDLVLPARWYSWLSEKRANSGRPRAPDQVLRDGRAPSGTAAAA